MFDANRIGIAGMHLNRQRVARIDELGKQGHGPQHLIQPLPR